MMRTLFSSRLALQDGIFWKRKVRFLILMHANVWSLFQLVQSGWIIERVMQKDSLHSMVTYISQVGLLQTAIMIA